MPVKAAVVRSRRSFADAFADAFPVGRRLAAGRGRRRIIPTTPNAPVPTP